MIINKNNTYVVVQIKVGAPLESLVSLAPFEFYDLYFPNCPVIADVAKTESRFPGLWAVVNLKSIPRTCKYYNLVYLEKISEPGEWRLVASTKNRLRRNDNNKSEYSDKELHI